MEFTLSRHAGDSPMLPSLISAQLELPPQPSDSESEVARRVAADEAKLLAIEGQVNDAIVHAAQDETASILKGLVLFVETRRMLSQISRE